MEYFRRYTNLAATIHLLRSRTITLLNPATWDDKNDAYFMAEYKRYKNAKSVLALCFAETSETYHHWRVFSHGSDGVCIEFHKEKLLGLFDGENQIKHGPVIYKTIEQAKKPSSIDAEKLPFLKRYPYKDEREYRAVFIDQKKSMEYKDLQIQLNCIKRIILSPWMSKALRDSVRSVLKESAGSSKIKIIKSGLVDNDTWKALSNKVKIKNLES